MPHLVNRMARKSAEPAGPPLAYLRRAHGAYVKTWSSVPLTAPAALTDDAEAPMAPPPESS